MPEAHRHRDICTGHGCYPPRSNVGKSDDVFVNGRGWHCQGHYWPSHCCGDPCHDGNLKRGSSTVYVNGKQAGRIGDPVNCGSAAATGSPNVFAGG